MSRFLMASLLLALAGLSPLSGQVKPPDEPITPEEYDPSEFPLWAHDIRRFEIITFGTFPVTYFLSSLVYDITILAINNGSAEYGLGSQRGEDDLAIIIGAAAATSVTAAIVDLIINVSRRKNNSDEQRMLHSADP